MLSLEIPSLVKVCDPYVDYFVKQFLLFEGFWVPVSPLIRCLCKLCVLCNGHTILNYVRGYSEAMGEKIC